MSVIGNTDFAESFAPISRRDAKVLILGSIPGRESLKAGQYYANPRNQFWKIMAALLGFAPDASYADRLLALQASGIALWDVLASCERRGSLDASIQRRSEKVNDFAGFFAHHTDVRAVFCNGAKAFAGYQACARQTARSIPPATCLPSTSPAHASLSFAQKLDAWKVILEPMGRA